MVGGDPVTYCNWLGYTNFQQCSLGMLLFSPIPFHIFSNFTALCLYILLLVPLSICTGSAARSLPRVVRHIRLRCCHQRSGSGYAAIVKSTSRDGGFKALYVRIDLPTKTFQSHSYTRAWAGELRCWLRACRLLNDRSHSSHSKM
jgi:hypothetical protein